MCPHIGPAAATVDALEGNGGSTTKKQLNKTGSVREPQEIQFALGGVSRRATYKKGWRHGSQNINERTLTYLALETHSIVLGACRLKFVLFVSRGW